MKTNFFGTFLLLAVLSSTASATNRYVDLNCLTPTPPYTNWSTAATNIQDAVDAASANDFILVTNGVYASGARLYQGMSNRLVVTRAGMTVQNVNGPEQTIIQGWQVPGITNGPGAIRCVYISSSAVLSGFTVTNGATIASGDEFNQRSGGGIWSSSSDLAVTNCVITGNSASRDGGGVYGYCTMKNCTLIGNSAVNGGGAYGSGVWLDQSRLIANSAQFGGGLYQAGAHASVFTGNSADTGGGAWGSSLMSCTLTHNLARTGGGTSGGNLNNCIVFFNSASAAVANFDSGTLNGCCTTPLPSSGAGNASFDPLLGSTAHLSADSPCRSAGADAYAALRDFDGETWHHPPSIGCDEYNAGAVTGVLTVAMCPAYTNVAAGFGVEFTALINGRTSASVWQFGDGAAVSNRPFATHAWASAGDYPVTLTAYNQSHPEGVEATVTMHVLTTPVNYVRLGSTNPVAPYGTWETAAGDIQSAVDAATLPGAVVMVDAGVYDNGGRVVDGLMTNRVAVKKPITVQSVNGPAATWIAGYQVPGTTNGDGAIRCVYLSDGAVLAGFTLTNGATRKSGDAEHEEKGGGVWCPSCSAVVTNCVLTRNSAYERGGGIYGGTVSRCMLRDNSAQYGGGAYGSLLTGCVLTGNFGSLSGGGAAYAGLNNCTVVGNSSSLGGGAYSSWLNNCICYSNAAANYTGATLNFCCTTPQPSGGTGNFTNAPLLMDFAGRDFHLQSNSPCINAGANGFVSMPTDLDGNPRIAGGTVDVGAFEFQLPLSVISYAWLQSYGLPMDGSADTIDSDGDGMNNWQEWIAGTHPLDPVSALRMLSPVVNLPAVTLTWQSATNRTYSLQRAINSTGEACFTPIASNIPGHSSTTSFTDTNVISPGPVLYRVAVQSP